MWGTQGQFDRHSGFWFCLLINNSTQVTSVSQILTPSCFRMCYEMVNTSLKVSKELIWQFQLPLFILLAINKICWIGSSQRERKSNSNIKCFVIDIRELLKPRWSFDNKVKINFKFQSLLVLVWGIWNLFVEDKCVLPSLQIFMSVSLKQKLLNISRNIQLFYYLASGHQT